jgi:hypothetical protein
MADRFPAEDTPADNPALAGRVPDDQLPQTEAEWRQRLTPLQYEITRKKATERAFTGKYTDTETAGTYRCVCCGEPLFASGEKFHGGDLPSLRRAPRARLQRRSAADRPPLLHQLRGDHARCREAGEVSRFREASPRKRYDPPHASVRIAHAIAALWSGRSASLTRLRLCEAVAREA